MHELEANPCFGGLKERIYDEGLLEVTDFVGPKRAKVIFKHLGIEYGPEDLEVDKYSKWRKQQ
jgi:hypothetical protein